MATLEELCNGVETREEVSLRSGSSFAAILHPSSCLNILNLLSFPYCNSVVLIDFSNAVFFFAFHVDLPWIGTNISRECIKAIRKWRESCSYPW